MIVVDQRDNLSMRELALRHHQMVKLVVRALDHDAHESQRLELDDLARIARGDDELHAVRQILGPGLQPSAASSWA